MNSKLTSVKLHHSGILFFCNNIEPLVEGSSKRPVRHHISASLLLHWMWHRASLFTLDSVSILEALKDGWNILQELVKKKNKQ